MKAMANEPGGKRNKGLIRAAKLAIFVGFCGVTMALMPQQPTAPGRFETYISDVVEAGIDIGCEGGLTHQLAVSRYLGADYFPIHVECGGAPILDLEIGDKITIRDKGEYQVVARQDVPYGNVSAKLLANLAGEIVLQTCHKDNGAMRAVGLNKISYQNPDTRNRDKSNLFSASEYR